MRAVFNKSNGMKWGAILASGLLFALALPEIVDAANIRGKVSKGELLLNPVWEEARDPNSHRYTFREPSATVSAKMRKLFAHLPADVTVALLGDGAQASKANLRLAGGRGYPSTLVVAPGTELTLTNQDPFVHKPYVKGQSTFTAAVMQSHSTRTWQVPGPGVYELRDEAIPWVRIWIISEPKVVSAASPRRSPAW